MQKFTDWMEYAIGNGGYAVPNLEAHKALNFLCAYLLGDDWYITEPVGALQANTIIVDEILKKYSKAYCKECAQKSKKSKKSKNTKM